jgi:hypothetical protein
MSDVYQYFNLLIILCFLANVKNEERLLSQVVVV